MTRILKTPIYQLYLLQLENYQLGRFWKLLLNKGWFPPKQQRKNLVWTAKAKALMFLAVAFYVLIVVGLFWWSSHGPAIFIAAAIVLFFLYPLLFSLGWLILWPLDVLAKKMVIAKAKSRIWRLTKVMDPGSPPSSVLPPRADGLRRTGRLHSAGMTQEGLTIIGIAGSYGKTTMKEVLASVLSAKFKVAATPESVNTPVGIARWILKNVDESTNIIIVEMGEHYEGDVRELCKITRPDIAVVTGINEAHLERMKTMENVVATIFEIAQGSKPSGAVLINMDDENVAKEYQKFTLGKQVDKFSSNDAEEKKFDAEKFVWTCKIDNMNLEVALLGEYALADVSAAIKIAKSFGLSAAEITKGVTKIKPGEHRLQPIRGAGNALIIDDAYNGNPQGAAEAIKVLSRFTNRRKIYITPGLVETGGAVAQVHRQIGQSLAKVADVVILIKNSVTPWIEEGIKSVNEPTGTSTPKIVWFDTALEAHEALKNILQLGDVVLFQNDWGDQYW